MSDEATNCPKCGSDQLRWMTLRRSRVPVDVLQCQSCGVAVLEEDWMAPIQPLVPGRCLNCGERRDFDQCLGCGLTQHEDVQVHDELRFMVDPNASMLDAARNASRVGRRLLALKLATAAATSNDHRESEVARALRIWLLSAIGEPQGALEDAKAWVENQRDPSAMAWASYGQQLQNGAFPGGAADAYEKSLKKNPEQHAIRARRAGILLQLGRSGQASAEIIKVFSAEGADEGSISLALQVGADLCTMYETHYRDDEIERIIEFAADHVERSATLLAHRARVAAQQGDTSSAKRDLKKARKLDPELEIYERVERAMKPARSSWWRW